MTGQTTSHNETRLPSPLLAIALGPTRVVRSSLSSSWQGILLEKHISSPGERTSFTLDWHVVSMFQGAPARLEHRSKSGDFTTSVTRPKTLMITPSGSIPDIRLHTSAELIHCALEERFLCRVIDELDHATARPNFHIGIQDPSLQRILSLLLEELEAERPLGRLYVDSLAHALAMKYLLLDVATRRRSESRVAGLVPRVLNRVRGKIEANLDADLSLESLAEESGYSRAHFLRMFRAATGLTPHQYVLNLRLRRAQECLRQPGSSIIDVVVSCGFASQSHMTSLFRQHLGMTPAQFRRDTKERTTIASEVFN
jgi:AraC family transcriptional regulator